MSFISHFLMHPNRDGSQFVLIALNKSEKLLNDFAFLNENIIKSYCKKWHSVFFICYYKIDLNLKI